MELNFDKPNYLDVKCDVCCIQLEPYTLVFQNKVKYTPVYYVCLDCMKNRGYKIDKNLEKKLLNEQKDLQTNYYKLKIQELEKWII